MFKFNFLYGATAEKLAAKKAASLDHTINWSKYHKKMNKLLL